MSWWRAIVPVAWSTQSQTADQVAPESVDLKSWASGHQRFSAATTSVPGCCMSRPKPPKPWAKVAFGTGVMSFQVEFLRSYLQTDPLVPSKGPSPLL